MSKLQYHTKPPKKGYTSHESFATHIKSRYYDKMPPNETQSAALSLVSTALHDLLFKLEKLGYDPTKARFSIHWTDLKY